MEQKRPFRLLLAILAITLLLLPFVTTFSSALTEIVNGLGLYHLMQATLVPFESRLVVGIVRLMGIPAYLAPIGEEVSFYLEKGTTLFPVQLQWNCLGWQSLLFLILSLVVGLQGHFTNLSKLECITIGFLGTFLINIFRMVFITAGIYYIDTVFANLIHDYFAALTTIVWLIFFWFFCYSYVLEEENNPSN
jgi:exosortase/archaeosortase family protein